MALPCSRKLNMNDQHYEPICCNGNCKQGRQCPRYDQEATMSLGEKLTLFVGLLGWILFVCFILGFFYGSWRLV